MMIIASRRRLKDRNIQWKETYKERSLAAKKHFNKILPGAYFRWEGQDYETGHPYYVVVGPAISKRYGKAFFAGVKKMPRDPKKKAYAPSGEYFSSLAAALSHAVDMWGVSYPKDAGHYTKADLQPLDIPRHVKALEQA
jgi:hypothetical protein